MNKFEELAHDIIEQIEEDLVNRYPEIKTLQDKQTDEDGLLCGTLFNGLNYWGLMENIRDQILDLCLGYEMLTEIGKAFKIDLSYGFDNFRIRDRVYEAMEIK